MVARALLQATARIVQSLEPRQSLCILAARLMRDWLAEHGFRPAILPCRVLLSNDAVPEPQGWSVGIGHGYPDRPDAAFGLHTRRDSYNGHVVVRVGDLILDATLGQASDATRHINAGPLLACIPNEAFFAGVARFSEVFRWGEHPSLRVTYSAEPADSTYLRAHDWNCPQREDLHSLLQRRMSAMLYESASIA